ncbi:hypothetical protein EST38_g4383 [Candolleomyces aberdarensis]|uniref:Uncharacterized protein n=1 Tax=Candolleomyces aberdarensis TaxID=2316362 RepID=A0A4Q2DN91_9AGAR|nr:hypothetical protein EST38_g4383 [Candolleomyces aberdarensis]
MTCPSCCTTSCYVGRQAIDDFEHFYNNHQYGPDGRSPLWDIQPLQDLHAQEVQAAYERALAEQAPVARPAVAEPQGPLGELRAAVRDVWEALEDEIEQHPAATHVVQHQHPPYAELHLDQLVYDAWNDRLLLGEEEFERVLVAHGIDPEVVDALVQEMHQAKRETSLARRRAREAQKRVDEVRARERLYYHMLNGGMNVRPRRAVCFHYRPGMKRIRRTYEDYNPTPEREAREEHLQFALDEEQRYIEASEASCRRLREAQAVL